MIVLKKIDNQVLPEGTIISNLQAFVSDISCIMQFFLGTFLERASH